MCPPWRGQARRAVRSRAATARRHSRAAGLLRPGGLGFWFSLASTKVTSPSRCTMRTSSLPASGRASSRTATPGSGFEVVEQLRRLGDQRLQFGLVGIGARAGAPMARYFVAPAFLPLRRSCDQTGVTVPAASVRACFSAPRGRAARPVRPRSPRNALSLDLPLVGSGS